LLIIDDDEDADGIRKEDYGFSKYRQKSWRDEDLMVVIKMMKMMICVMVMREKLQWCGAHMRCRWVVCIFFFSLLHMEKRKGGYGLIRIGL